MKRFQSFSIYFLTIAVLGITMAAAPAFAQPATCDPRYWDSLKAKAWTEAEREIEQNQTYIYKADSILEYTCFDQFLNVLAANAPNLFSESTQWGVIFGPSMINALQSLVGNSLGNYISSNFSDSYLGDFSTLTYTPLSVASSPNYNCNELRKVWVAAKCQDIANSSIADGKANTSANTDFFYMSTYAANDYRRYPSGAECTVASTWTERLSVANNTGNQYPKETFNVYANFFNSTSCNAPTGVAAIPTGIIVKRAGIADYPEVICVNPGCAANRSGGCTN